MLQPIDSAAGRMVDELTFHTYRGRVLDLCGDGRTTAGCTPIEAIG
jgi:hypothetical protein